MLRSCYSTVARFYNGDATLDDLEWFFVRPGTPFLPFASVINSLNWIDASERVDVPAFAGEVPGEARNYSKGSRNVAYPGLTPGGTAVDFAGNGTRPGTASYDSFGVPLVCGGPVLEPMPGGSVPAPANIVTSGGGPFPVVTPQVSNTWGYDNLQFGLNSWITNYPLWQLDLYQSIPNPSGTIDFLTDFDVLNFNGYAAVVPGPQAINPDPGNTRQRYDQLGCAWTQVGPFVPGTRSNCHGLVLSDGNGLVLAYYDFTPAFLFFSDGDFLSLDWIVDALPWDYP